MTAIIAARIRPSLLELMDKVTLRAIDDWKHTGFGDSVQALLIAQDDSDNAIEGAAQMRGCAWPREPPMAEMSDSEAESAAARGSAGCRIRRSRGSGSA